MSQRRTRLAAAMIVAATVAVTPAGAFLPAQAQPVAGVAPEVASGGSGGSGGGSGGAAAGGGYPSRAYGSDPRSRDAYDDDGWGTGYADEDELGVVRYGGGAVRVRKQLVPLVRKLFWLTEHVYGYKIRSGQTFGYARRTIAGSDRISNHGRGLAIDINSLSNPMSKSFRSNLPPRLVRIWEQHGFDWGGYYRSTPDTMHFEFADNVDDVDRYFSSARKLVVKHERKRNRG